MKRQYRVIRKVTKMGRDGRPKVAVDRKTHLRVERVRAQAPRRCSYRHCPELAGIIEDDTEYARLTYPRKVRRFPQHWPESFDFHFQCLPPEARPLARFFKEPT